MTPVKKQMEAIGSWLSKKPSAAETAYSGQRKGPTLLKKNMKTYDV